MKTKKFLLFATLFIAVLCAGLVSCCEKDEEVNLSVQSSFSSTISSSSYFVKNGETIDLTTNVKGEVNGKPVLFIVDYFCDDNIIGTSKDSTNNYLVKYLVDGLAVGTHKLTSKSSYKIGNADLSSSATRTFTVTE